MGENKAAYCGHLEDNIVERGTLRCEQLISFWADGWHVLL